MHFIAYFSELLQIKLRARVRSAQLIEDIRQETFLRVFRSLRQRAVEHPERIGAFVNSVCNNVMFEQLRADSRAVSTDESHVEIRDPSPKPDSALLGDERLHLVRRILSDLPARDRDLLRAVFIDEEDKDVVCARFRVDRQYLRVLLHRARLRMKEEFRKLHVVRQWLVLFGI